MAEDKVHPQLEMHLQLVVFQYSLKFSHTVINQILVIHIPPKTNISDLTNKCNK